jgi:hypothetical protein
VTLEQLGRVGLGYVLGAATVWAVVSALSNLVTAWYYVELRGLHTRWKGRVARESAKACGWATAAVAAFAGLVSLL